MCGQQILGGGHIGALCEIVGVPTTAPAIPFAFTVLINESDNVVVTSQLCPVVNISKSLTAIMLLFLVNCTVYNYVF